MLLYVTSKKFLKCALLSLCGWLVIALILILGMELCYQAIDLEMTNRENSNANYYKESLK